MSRWDHDGAVGLAAGGATQPGFPLDQDRMQEPFISESTPYFHIDLVAAVRPAEKLGLKEEEEESESDERGPNGSSQGDIPIHL